MHYYAELFRPTLIAASLVLALPAGIAVCGPLEDSRASYDRGDYATALRLARPLADQGNAVAQFILGVMYDSGKGVLQDDAEAMKWYRKAADQGESNAQCNLGTMYLTGQGVLQDYPEAMKWYRKAAAQGNANAQFNLGKMYDNGDGVPQDYVEAVEVVSKGRRPGKRQCAVQLRQNVRQRPGRAAGLCASAYVAQPCGLAISRFAERKT
jgi:uncharacterized protein